MQQDLCVCLKVDVDSRSSVHTLPSKQASDFGHFKNREKEDAFLLMCASGGVLGDQISYR